MIETYEKVQARRVHDGKCEACGRFVRRSRIFTHTVNPFNRNASGQPKTYDEVVTAVNAEADAWVPDFTHEGCK